MRKKWFFENLRSRAMLYNSKAEFRRSDPAAFSAASKRQDFNQICSHMKKADQSGENNPFFKWTFDKLRKIALSYENRVDFEKGDPAAYQASYKRDDYELIVSHMSPSKTKAYTFEEICLKASEYVYLNDFKKNSCGYYHAAMKSQNRIEIFKNLKIKRHRNYTLEEILSEIKKWNTIIEFDGKYHHSFEFMRKDRYKKLWSDDDIRNYHKLKDDWFETKGIKILHIKEEEWKVNKQACIDKCLLFLGILKSPSEDPILAA